MSKEKAINPTEPTQEQIDAWKKKHGQVFKIEVEDKVCFLKKPDRKTISAASAIGQKNPIKFAETILQNCWLAGDEEIKEDDDYFFAVSGELDQLLEFKNAELKKL
jgi:hypothetical protein